MVLAMLAALLLPASCVDKFDMDNALVDHSPRPLTKIANNPLDSDPGSLLLFLR